MDGQYQDEDMGRRGHGSFEDLAEGEAATLKYMRDRGIAVPGAWRAPSDNQSE